MPVVKTTWQITNYHLPLEDTEFLNTWKARTYAKMGTHRFTRLDSAGPVVSCIHIP